MDGVSLISVCFDEILSFVVQKVLTENQKGVLKLEYLRQIMFHKVDLWIYREVNDIQL